MGVEPFIIDPGFKPCFGWDPQQLQGVGCLQTGASLRKHTSNRDGYYYISKKESWFLNFIISEVR